MHFSEELRQELKETRVAQKLTLAQVAETTKIKEDYLRAIEEGDEQALPSPFYTRAFAKKYAALLGLHPAELFDQEAFDPYLLTDLSTAHRDEDGVVRAGVNQTATFKSRFQGWIVKIWALIIVLVLILLAWFLITRMNAGSNNSSSQQSSQSLEYSSTAVSQSSSAKKASFQLNEGQVNQGQKTTTFNTTGSQNQVHHFVVKGQDGGSTVKITDATGKELFNAWVNKDEEKSVDLPANVANISIALSQVSHASMTVNNSHLDLKNLPTNPAATNWTVMMNFNK
ncbi:helix-turn-helix transcriptional regulator [Leuconostocaceae bacterium ESL0958]|nr:helix-turn-helix transcriptional regulator [Leuconostocaceae bacterium ESL0958]